MSIITAVRDRVVSDRNPAPRGMKASGRRFTKPRDLRTFVHTHGSVVGFRVITDRGTFFSPGRKPGMVPVVTMKKVQPPMAWYRDDLVLRDDFVARLRGRITGTWPRGAWRRMTPIPEVFND
jgi:hypothetical protein